MTDAPQDSPAPLPAWKQAWGDLCLAGGFLTRLPMPECAAFAAFAAYADGALARSMRVFPLVGALVGLVAGAIFLGATQVLPPLAAALLALLAALLLTGGLHEDGLADTADGLGARGGVEARLAVMRDSRSGSFGVLALVFAIGLKAACLQAAPSGLAGLGALVAAAALSRALIPAAMQVMGPARPDGLGAGAGTPDASAAALAGVLGILLAFAGLGLDAPAALAGGVILAGGVVLLARRTLGGHTGDVLGAVQQAAETGILLAVAMVWP